MERKGEEMRGVERSRAVERREREEREKRVKRLEKVEREERERGESFIGWGRRISSQTVLRAARCLRHVRVRGLHSRSWLLSLRHHTWISLHLNYLWQLRPQNTIVLLWGPPQRDQFWEPPPTAGLLGLHIWGLTVGEHLGL